MNWLHCRFVRHSLERGRKLKGVIEKTTATFLRSTLGVRTCRTGIKTIFFFIDLQHLVIHSAIPTRRLEMKIAPDKLLVDQLIQNKTDSFTIASLNCCMV